MNLIQAQDNEPTLLMAQVYKLTDTQEVHLGREEEHHDDIWYLDTRVSNHMSRCKESFTELDSNIKGSVKFGDSSVVDIYGHGTVMFTCHNGEPLCISRCLLYPKAPQRHCVSRAARRTWLPDAQREWCVVDSRLAMTVAC